MEVYVPGKPAYSELIVKGSRFISETVRISSPGEARDHVRGKKEEYADSTHVVWAFMTGPPNSRTMGMSDDGEPKGTAGRPVLEVVKGSGLTDLLVTVVRYFGGTKLGTGGLVRAYTDAAKGVLEKTPREKLVTRLRFTVTVPYDIYEHLRRSIADRDGALLGEEFRTEVTLTGEIEERWASSLDDEVAELSRGSIYIDWEKG